jgi:hypothetical protein
LLVTVGCLLFVALGLELWIAPEQAAGRLGLSAVNAAGVAALRSDIGGLFIGMAVLCAAALWTGRRLWFIAAASILSAIVVGRSIGWISVGPVDDVLDLVIELGIIASLIIAARPPASSNAPEKRRTLRPIIVAAAVVFVTAGAAAALSPGVQQRIFDAAAEQRTADVNAAPRTVSRCAPVRPPEGSTPVPLPIRLPSLKNFVSTSGRSSEVARTRTRWVTGPTRRVPGRSRYSIEDTVSAGKR